MRVQLSLLAVVAILSMTALTACNSTEGRAITAPSVSAAASPAPQAPADDIPRISIADARQAFESGKAVIIDVRGEPSYKAGHIKGSSLIALGEIANRSAELPKDKQIILYCSCPTEHSSVAAAQALKTKNVTNTAALVGGYNAWVAAGYPIEPAAK